MEDFEVPEDGDRIVIDMKPRIPMELGDLSKSLGGIARIYDRHYEQAPKLHITEIKTGSVIFQLSPLDLVLGTLVIMNHTVVVADFVKLLSDGIKKLSGLTKSPAPLPRDDASDIKAVISPLIHHPEAMLRIAQYKYKDRKKGVLFTADFFAPELRRAHDNIDMASEGIPDLTELETLRTPNETPSHMQNVTLMMERASRKLKGNTGDRAIVPAISNAPFPVTFRHSYKDLKSEMTKAVNPFTHSFVVDVFIKYKESEPSSYIVTELHKTIPPERNT